MRILHIINSLGHGGAQRQMVQLAGSLATRGHVQRVATLLETGNWWKGLSDADIPTTNVGVEDGLFIAWQRLRRVRDAFCPDIVQSWLYHSNIAAALTQGCGCLVWNVRHSLHDFAGEKWPTRLVILGSALVAPRAQAIVYNSARAARQHEVVGYPVKKTAIIDNGIDTHRFRRDLLLRNDQREAWGVSEDQVVVGMVGRFHRVKGVDVLLRAMEGLPAGHDRVRLVLAGEGMEPGNSELTRHFSVLSRSAAVILTGPRKDVESIMNGLDVLVSVSAGEAWPNVVGEAMACGVPCIVSDVGEAPRLVGSTGIVLEHRSEDSLRQALTSLISESRDKREARGAAAAAHISKEFSIDYCTGQYERLYADLMGGQVS